MSRDYNKILECKEYKGFGRYSSPKTLREFGVERIINRKVLEWCGYLGSYGMGGPGFFGLRLESNTTYRIEWLILILWGASEWILLDNQWVSSHPNQYHIQRPLLADGKDEVTGKIIGATISNTIIERNETFIYLQHNANEHLLEVPSDYNRLPIYGGSLKPRKWTNWEHHLDAWVISRKAKLHC